MSAKQADSKTPQVRPVHWRRRILFAVVYLLFLYLLGEVGARAYWSLTRKTPFFGTSAIRQVFHREVGDSRILDTIVSRESDPFTVLLLGGSVLRMEFGEVERTLEDRLTRGLQRPVRVFNLGQVAHTSRDSWLKYRQLKDKRFDLVVNYDNINDVRMNNVPAASFRRDYSHAAWYVWMKRLRRHPELEVTALPYTAEFTAVKFLQWLRLGYMPLHKSHGEWLEHGSEIKTAETLQRNLERIIRTASHRGDPVMLMTFAIHHPDDYTLERFQRKELDYGEHLTPTELWGLPHHVVRTVEVHNGIIRELAGRYPEVMLVDQAQLMPRSKVWFNDICHLTPAGCTVLVENIAQAVHARLAALDH